MKLDKLHILYWDSSINSQRESVARGSETVGSNPENSSAASRCQHRGFGIEHLRLAACDIISRSPAANAVCEQQLLNEDFVVKRHSSGNAVVVKRIHDCSSGSV